MKKLLKMLYQTALCFLLLVSISSVPILAQEDEDVAPPMLMPLYEEDVCHQIEFVAKEMIIYENDATLYLRANTKKYRKGAAKHMDNWAWGKKIHSRYSISEDESFGTNAATISIHWRCTDTPLFYPDDCRCQKNVPYIAQYDTRLRTAMTLPSCALCGNKGGKAKAEDHGTLLLYDHEGRSEILALGRSTVESECDENFNVDFLIESIDVATDLARLILQAQGEDPDPTQLLETAEDLLDDIVTLVQTPIINATGCSAKNETATLVNNTGSFELSPNKPTYLMLGSRGATYVHGYTSWNGHARVTSNFHLALAFENGIVGTKCCSDGVGCWAMESFEAAPNNITSLQAQVRQFMLTLFLPYDNSLVGTLWNDVECVQGDGFDDGNEKNNTSDLSQYIHERRATSVSCYNVLGQQIPLMDDTFDGSSLTVYLPNTSLSSGIYLLEIIYSDNSREVKKVFYDTKNTNNYEWKINLD